MKRTCIKLIALLITRIQAKVGGELWRSVAESKKELGGILLPFKYDICC